MSYSANDIAYVDFNTMVVVLADGERVPITNCFDASGEECLPDDEVASIVAGSDELGCWWAIPMSDLERTVVH